AAERVREVGEALAVAEEQPRRADGARGEDDDRRGVRALAALAEHLVADLPVAAGARRRRDPGRLVVGLDLGAVLLGPGDVGDVDRVLGGDGAADVAAAEVLARLLRHAAERVPALLAEVDGDRERLRGAAGELARGGEGANLAEAGRRGLRVQRLLGQV